MTIAASKSLLTVIIATTGLLGCSASDKPTLLPVTTDERRHSKGSG